MRIFARPKPSRSGTKPSRYVLLVLVPLALAGCTHASAKTAPEMPALDIPAPPARDVEPNPVEAPPPPAPAAAEPARPAPPRPRPAAQPTRPEPAKPDVPADDLQKPTLQTTPATGEVELERAIRASVARADADLGRVDYRRLNADARMQYDTAKRFMRQVDDYMRSRNFVAAKNLADKAATLAAQLAGR